MERVNEKDHLHQFEYLEHRLICTRYVEGTYRWKMIKVWRKTWQFPRWKRVKEYIIKNHPVGLGYFTVRQLLYILNDIRENYFRETHIFAFGQEKFLVWLVPNKDDEIGDYQYPPPRQWKREPNLRKQDQPRVYGLDKQSRK